MALSMPNLAFTSSEMRDIAEELSALREQREKDDDASSTDSFVSATEVSLFSLYLHQASGSFGLVELFRILHSMSSKESCAFS